MSTYYAFCQKPTDMQSISVANNNCIFNYTAATLNGHTNNHSLGKIIAWPCFVITAENMETQLTLKVTGVIRTYVVSAFI